MGGRQKVKQYIKLDIKNSSNDTYLRMVRMVEDKDRRDLCSYQVSSPAYLHMVGDKAVCES
ncbi:Uncharacterised protein [Porphyromonas crevioricanis]|uniref:Uncharacterized protein n=1 Tax=Porphyromonas crevioricanis TaxID=393921 RepID=A0A2X4PKU9_9PORP|nr:hypothetical protein SAMN02745203_01565 [Porphyromonas crevioricanis]SQH72955.1 Uncharacterised protein [Porphyromonas crevioricanis]